MKTTINYYTNPRRSPKGEAAESIEEKPMVASFGQNEHPIFSRAILFDQEINEMTATALRAEVMAKAAENPTAPIYLFLGSPGGGLYESLAIYDTFQLVPNPIVAICSGKVMSGGILILLGCEVRLSTPNTTFMIHHGHTQLAGNVVQLKEQHSEIESLNDRMLDIIIKKTKISREQLKAWLVKDHYMNNGSAHQHGLIHSEIEGLEQLMPPTEEESDMQEIILTPEQAAENMANLNNPKTVADSKATKKKTAKKSTKKKVSKKTTKKK